MCGCGVTMSRRQWLWAMAMASAATVVSKRAWAAAPDPAVVQAILKATPVVDTHTHAAGAILSGAPTDTIAEQMKKGGVAGPVSGQRARRPGAGPLQWETDGDPCPEPWGSLPVQPHAL